MQNRDLIRLRHMLDSAQAILSFTNGKSHKDIISNRLLASGVVREFEILGEAANAISKNVQDQFQLIPWKSIIGMRNRLIHAYFDTDYDILWKTIDEELPNLIKHLENAISILSKS